VWPCAWLLFVTHSVTIKEKALKINSILSDCGCDSCFDCILICPKPSTTCIGQREHSVTAYYLTLQKVLQTAGDATGQVTREDWMGFCQHVEETMLGKGWFSPRCGRQHSHEPQIWQGQWGQHFFQWRFSQKRFDTHQTTQQSMCFALVVVSSRCNL
jgi:hypothetical protein